MFEDLVPRYAALLREHYLFQGLSEAQLAHVVTRFVPVQYEQGEVVFSQDDKGDNFYIVFEGSVRLSHVERDKEKHVDILDAADYFGEEALMFNRPRPFTVTVLEPTILLRLDREPFFELLRQFPQLKLNLSATADSRMLAQTGKFEWVDEDEVIYLITRKHVFFLFLSLLLPAIAGVVSVVVLAYGFSSAQSPQYAITLGAIGIAIAILWMVWNWMDWGNDFYIVTNQRVLWMEKVVALYSSRREAPLTQILSVNVTRSWLGRILGYGDVDVRTFTGSILMRRMDSPTLFARFVEGFQTRAMQVLKKEEAKKMELAVKERFEQVEEPQPESENIQPPTEQVPPPKQVKPGSFREKWDTFFKVRYEQGGVITYRKHWLMLFKKIWFPSLGILLIGAVGLYILWQIWTENADVASYTLILFILGLIFIFFLFWWVYNYVDWSNDVYQLTPDQIRDIERKPLGEEHKKVAALDSILSLEHTREGIIQLAFNYGNVIIMVGTTPFIFRGVYNPDQVHQDVADYIEARSRKKKEQEAQQERQKMVDWLSVYHHQAQILEQRQNRHNLDNFPGKIGPEDI